MPKIYKTQIYEMPNSNLQNAKSLQKTNLNFTKCQITQKCKTIKPKISQITTRFQQLYFNNYISTTRFQQLYLFNYILTTRFQQLYLFSYILTTIFVQLHFNNYIPGVDKPD